MDAKRLDKFLATLSKDELRYVYGAADAMMEGEDPAEETGEEAGAGMGGEDMSEGMGEDTSSEAESEPAPAPRKPKSKKEDDMVEFDSL